RERIERDLAVQRFQLRLYVPLQLLICRRSGRPRSKRNRVAREFERGGPAEVRGPNSGCGQNQERLKAVHIYPSVKLRSRSSESNHGRTSAGGTRTSAATINNGPGKNCNPFSSRRASKRKKPPTGSIVQSPNPA